MNWREQLLRILRVPAEPTPPPGSPPRVFRAAPNYYKLRLIRWALTQVLAITGLLVAIYIVGTQSARMPSFVAWMFRIGEIAGAIAIAFEATLGWLIVRLDFELRWYMLSDRAIRIREGITTVREKTIALANIQNIAVKQGPLQRFLGIADVEVNTAGGGGSSNDLEGKKSGAEPMHVAYFRGVDNAEEIRDLLREGVRRQRDAGLGDPDERAEEPPAAGVDEAAALLLAEARALREAVAPEKIRLKLMFEWGGGALWCDNEKARARFDDGLVDDLLPLSQPLRDRLQELAVWHDTSLNQDYPPDPGPWSEEEYARFEAAAREALDQVRRELGDEYEVRYVPL